MSYYAIRYEDSLEHHDILGQKWGKRNGPPYPLDYESHSAKEKKENPKTKISGTESLDKSRKGLTDKQKKIIRNASIAIAGITIAYAGAKLASSPKVRGMVSKSLNKIGSKPINDFDGLEVFSKKLGRNLTADEIDSLMGNNSIDGFDGLSYNGLEESLKSVLKKKPEISKIEDFFEINSTAFNEKLIGTNKNCVGCSITSVLRSMGYDCTAKPALRVDPKSGMATAKGFGFKSIEKAFIGTKHVSKNFNSWSEARSELLKLGEGATGVIGARRTNIEDTTRHAIRFEVKNNRVIFSDAQSAQKLLRTALANNIPEDRAKKMIYLHMHDIGDDMLDKTTVFTDAFRYIRLDTATGVDFEKLKDFILPR